MASAESVRASSVDATGLVLAVTYEDGSAAEVDSGFYCTFADKSAGESRVDVFYEGCATEYPIEITADTCAFTVSYIDQAGLTVADDATGSGMAGSEVELVAPAVEGYMPLEESKTVTVAPGARYTVEYAKNPLPSVDDAVVEIAPSSYVYTGQSLHPEVTVKFGSETLVRDRDYYLEYGENVDAGTGLVMIGGLGAYGGISLREFPIDPIKVAAPKAKKGLKYTGMSQTGVAAAKGYTVKGGSAVSGGTHTATVSLDHNYAWADGTTDALRIEWSIAKIANAITMKTGAVVKTGSVKSAQAFTRTGKASGGTVKYTSNSKYVPVSAAGKVTVKKNFTGTAVITASCKGNANYKAATAKKYTVKVKPGKMALKKAAAVKGGRLKATWDKMAGADKYQVRVALDSQFTKGKKAYDAGGGVASKTTAKLVQGKTYYVQVRAYDKQTKSWGAWSAAKKVKAAK